MKIKTNVKAGFTSSSGSTGEGTVVLMRTQSSQGNAP
jgi:hypothetical protein